MCDRKGLVTAGVGPTTIDESMKLLLMTGEMNLLRTHG